MDKNLIPTLLFDFNTSHVSVELFTQPSTTIVPIYFNTSHVSVEQRTRWRTRLLLEYFNTSHVSVELLLPLFYNANKVKFQYITCIGWTSLTRRVGILFGVISIHHMYRLNKRTRWRTRLLLEYFNTSHVSVEPGRANAATFLYHDFNTSHVSVEHSSHTFSLEAVIYFNTSHVSVEHI